MKKATYKIGLYILSIFFITYCAYQGYKSLHKPYKTEVAYNYTVVDSYTGRGFFIRDEEEFPVDSGGAVSFIYPDGAKVNKNSIVAECFENEDSAKITYNIHQLENQIKDLEEINTGSKISTVATESVSKKIMNDIVLLNKSVYAKDLSNLNSKCAAIINDINKKQINSGTVKNFDEKIEQLKSELEYLKSTLKTETQEILSPMNGYFTSTSDMCGDKISPAMLDDINSEFCEKVISSPPEINDRYAKIIKSHNWYFALNVSGKDLDKFKEGREVTVSFPLLNKEDIEAVVYQINVKESDKPGEAPKEGVIILKSDYVLDKLTTARVTEIKINFKSYSGLKINSDAIRFYDNAKGVYIISDQQIKFKPINIIYEGNGYVIISETMEGASTVRFFDEVIVEGVELYDGKSI